MKIGFTGHRNCMVKVIELDAIAQKYPGATWVHGGAKGFDAQVHSYTFSRNIPCLIIRPEYDRYPGKVAPLKRNETIVDMCEILYACYDERTQGGTFYTINYARRCGKTVVVLAPQRTMNTVIFNKVGY